MTSSFEDEDALEEGGDDEGENDADDEDPCYDLIGFGGVVVVCGGGVEEDAIEGRAVHFELFF
jgi:hypothetical protein